MRFFYILNFCTLNFVNKKARIRRKFRFLRDRIGGLEGFKLSMRKRGKVFVLLFLIFFMPVYPTFVGYVHGGEYEFSRVDIDEESILGSYYIDDYDNQIDTSESDILIESQDSFLSINTLLDDERNLAGTNEIVDYEVKPGDSISAIAYNFQVSNNSIYWANDFSRSHIIQPGDIIKIPPVTGLIYQVKKNDTVAGIAKKYKISKDKILSQNLLTADAVLKTGEVIVLPGAIKKKKPVIRKPAKTYVSASKGSQAGGGYSFAKYASSQYVSATGRYKLVRRKPQARFYWGNCTRYVGQYKNVNWQGNANQWLTNAKRKGHPTGSTPTLGSIVVLNGRGYNPKYGHVAIVMDIKGSHIIVSDMNYRKLNEVTYRKIPINDRAIKGYIYVD